MSVICFETQKLLTTVRIQAGDPAILVRTLSAFNCRHRTPSMFPSLAVNQIQNLFWGGRLSGSNSLPAFGTYAPRAEARVPRTNGSLGL